MCRYKHFSGIKSLFILQAVKLRPFDHVPRYSREFLFNKSVTESYQNVYKKKESAFLKNQAQRKAKGEEDSDVDSDLSDGSDSENSTQPDEIFNSWTW
ncbi:hypothetical protein NQ317_019863 [Molorchus minor]|uniref:Uncharacterized protein n=1 Tax=Molorchus minor TaxID=1323400 RepID=A0ABQ9ITU3_9CUCU|nr:hypothetical protein NQ317_019863 [Molorchus minor]